MAPIDLLEEEAAVASKLKIYEVVHNGVTTTMKLDEAAAKRYGVWREPAKKTASSKKRSAPNKSGS